MTNTETKKVKIIPKQPRFISDILQLPARIDEEMQLELNVREIIRCMQFADVYDEETMMPLWDSEENLAAGKYYVEKLGPTMPEGHINMTSGESMAQFDAGNLAMIIEFYSRTLYLGGEDSSIQGKFDFALLPTEDEERPHATILSTNFIGIYSKSEKKEMAMDFLQELTSKETAKKMAFHEPDGMYNV